LSPHSNFRHPDGSLDVSLSAGLGSFFAAISFAAMLTYSLAPLSIQIKEAVAIIVVSIGIVKFIEPLIDRWSTKLHISSHDSHARPPIRSWKGRIAAFGIVAMISFSHGLLHDYVNGLFEQSPSERALFGRVVGLIISTPMVSAVVTWHWILGAQHTPPRSRIYGVVSGMLASFVVVFIIEALVYGGFEEGSILRGPIFPVLEIIIGSNPSIARYTLLGFTGGCAIDLRWGSRPSVGIAVTLVISIFLIAALRALGGNLNDIVFSVIESVGWSIGLMLHPLTDSLLITGQSRSLSSNSG
jgi:hypothetical protein